MKMAILETDVLTQELQLEFGSYGKMFKALLQDHNKNIEFGVFDVVNTCYPVLIDDFDVYLITGSKSSVYEERAWIKQLKQFLYEVIESKKIIIGICFGHQLIAELLGGKTQKSSKGWGVGVAKSQVILKKPWMLPVSDTFSIIVSHQDQVTQLPDNAELIASNDFCLHAMYQINNQILCLQGHPEFSKKYSQSRMLSRLKLIGERDIKKGIESLNQPIDDQLIAQWIVNFSSNKIQS
ncbi:MAG: GMP synthase [Methylococcales bacterium]|jgi:GMP synthase-like glutamine amidotransferase|nr:GMP synthase [Methylococcales bacterium]